MNIRKPTHPKEIGEVAELAVITACRSLGIQVSVPVGDNAAYDMIIDHSGLYKCQIKTGRLRDFKIYMPTARYRLNTKGGYRKPYSKYEVDLFFSYCFENGNVYVIPNLGWKKEISFRTIPAANNQSVGVYKAELFELQKFIAAHFNKDDIERIKAEKHFYGWDSLGNMQDST